MTLVKKITEGYVEQTFENGKCVEQKFVASDQVDWENKDGNRFDWINGIPDWALHVYHPFDMIQPTE